MDGKLLNSEGVHLATILGSEIFDPSGHKLYDLRGAKIYKTTGELVGHLRPQGSEKRLDKATDKLFPLRSPRR
jgi:hypothetical protein